MTPRWEQILGVALDQLEERGPEAEQRARDTLRQLRGVAAVRVEVIDDTDAAALEAALPGPFEPFLRVAMQLAPTEGYTAVGVSGISGLPQWIGRGVFGDGVGRSLEFIASGPAIGSLPWQRVEVYGPDHEPFMAFALREPAIAEIGDRVSVGWTEPGGHEMELWIRRHGSLLADDEPDLRGNRAAWHQTRRRSRPMLIDRRGTRPMPEGR